MRFWDTSALVPTFIGEVSSTRIRATLADDPSIVVWWATNVECASALSRRARTESEGAAKLRAAYDRLDKLASTWSEIPPSDALRDSARRLVRIHDLRAADAFQLAAARVASDESPETLPFVTLDERLAVAAGREGFPVLGLT